MAEVRECNNCKAKIIIDESGKEIKIEFETPPCPECLKWIKERVDELCKK